MNPNDKKQIASADRIAKSVERLYHQLIGQVVGLYGEGLVFDPKEVFHFANSPIINALVTKIFAHHTEKIIGNIQAETKRQWLSSVEKNTQIVQGFLQGAEVSSEKMKIYTSRNLEALARFQQRKTNGLNLSERIWKYSDQLKIELEMALDLGLREGRSARQLSRDIRQYLHEPNLLFRRVKDTHGNLHLSKRAEKMQVGRGVYRSAYKNAMRVARTEVNMAYRAADMEKYRQLDFVLGYEVKRSNRLFGCPVCEALKGKYPKDFQFLGWHPQCRCYTTPILNDLEEFLTHQQAILDGKDYTPSQQITDVPDNFKHWITDNRERLENAKSLPLFVGENKNFTDEKIGERYKEFQKLQADKNYTDVSFNRKNGGLKATHRLHNFDDKGGKYEKEVQNIGYEKGYSVILEAEIHNINNQRNTDGSWDNFKMEIAGVETGTSNNIRNALKHCASKKITEISILYFPNNNFSKTEFEKGLAKYNGLKKHSGQYLQFKEIICIHNSEIVYRKKPLK